MPRRVLTILYGAFRPATGDWISITFDLTPDPLEAKPFALKERCERFIALHLGADADAWQAAVIPQPVAEAATVALPEAA